MKEIFSEKVAAGSRTYFFDVKESREGLRYLVISESRVPKAFVGTSKAFSLDEVRQKHPRACEKWTLEEDERLRSQYKAGLDISTLAAMLQRQPSAIQSRLIKLGLTPQD